MISFESALAAALGGALIGLASAAWLVGFGQVAGVSGLFGGVVAPATPPARPVLARRLAFVLGLAVAGALGELARPGTLATASPTVLIAALAGLLVGVGTRASNGCTSGHGVCGVGRLAPRSLVATGTFMATGMATATLWHVLGGAS